MTVAVFIFSLLGAMALGMPIAFALLVCAVALMIHLGNFDAQIIAQNVLEGTNNYPLMAVPFFILAADLMSASAITTSILRFTNGLVGHIRGGLGHVNVLTNMVFAGISGSALADAAGPGAILMRMMQRAGYEKHYSAALSAATATIGPIIPPSIIMVVYAILGMPAIEVVIHGLTTISTGGFSSPRRQ